MLTCIHYGVLQNVIAVQVLYTSSVDEILGDDSDTDNLSDMEEYRTIYIVSMDSDDGAISAISITTDGRETIPVDSKAYIRLCDFVEPIIDLGQTIAVCDSYSNPNNRDTDGDYYIDSVDTRPRKSGLQTINLGGSSFVLTEHDDSGYIHIDNPPSRRGYGGYQGWFSEDTFYNINLQIRDTGCGLIATNDVLLYLNNGISRYEWSEYHDAVISTYYEFMDSQYILNFQVPNSFAIFPLCVQECLLYNGHISSMYTVNSLNQELLFEIIEESIIDNRPVILLEDDRVLDYSNTLFGDNNPIQRNGFPLYSINDSNLNSYTGFNDIITEHATPMIYHYVTITGIIIDDNAPLPQDRVYLRVQSWGEDFYLKYSDFVLYNFDNATCNGAIITVY